jgi:hypothetical protein
MQAEMLKNAEKTERAEMSEDGQEREVGSMTSKPRCLS